VTSSPSREDFAGSESNPLQATPPVPESKFAMKRVRYKVGEFLSTRSMLMPTHVRNHRKYVIAALIEKDPELEDSPPRIEIISVETVQEG